MEKHPPAYLSPSRLASYAWCPAQFHKHYVLNQPDPATPEMSFGTAVHAGIEAMMRDEDADLAYLRSWRELRNAFTGTVRVVADNLTSRGLVLLEMVRDLGISGEPERHVVYTHPGITIPLLGYVDLWGDGHIYDYKTTGYAWSQKKADRQIFQPAIYSWAYALEHDGQIPKFTYVTMSRFAGPVQLFDGTRSAEQIESAFELIKEIHELIEAKVFDCSCGKHLEAA